MRESCGPGDLCRRHGSLFFGPRHSTAVVPNPHDTLFRHVFDDPARALDLLRAVPPSALGDVLNASSLERQP